MPSSGRIARTVVMANHPFTLKVMERLLRYTTAAERGWNRAQANLRTAQNAAVSVRHLTHNPRQPRNLKKRKRLWQLGPFCKTIRNPSRTPAQLQMPPPN